MSRTKDNQALLKEHFDLKEKAASTLDTHAQAVYLSLLSVLFLILKVHIPAVLTKADFYIFQACISKKNCICL